MIKQDSKFLIVGLGLLGGSYALGLKKRNYHVAAIDTNEEAIKYALEQGIIDEGSSCDMSYIKEADYIILGLYPTILVDWVKEHAHEFKEGAIITDVCGIKSFAIDSLQALMPKNVEYITHHPMAGKEVSGVFYSDEKIFLNANYIIVPTDKNTVRGFEFINDLGNILRFNRIVTLTPAEHDEMIAFLSQLPHVIAVCLMNCKDNTHLSAYTGDSFRDLTRIAKINDQLWSELFLLNKDQLLDQIDLFDEQLQVIRQAIVDDNKEELTDLFKTSTQRRKAFDK